MPRPNAARRHKPASDPAPPAPAPTGTKTYWTRDTVLAGGLLFLREHDMLAPLSTAAWNAEQPPGEGRGRRGRYPSTYAVFRHFGSFRQFWEAVAERYRLEIPGVDRTWQGWRKDEEEFISEATGLLTQEEIARLLKRPAGGVKSRLYCIGRNSRHNNPHGWTMNQVARATGVGQHVLRDYLRRNEVPYLQGVQSQYIDPADLVGVVDEIDWRGEKNVGAELRAAIMRSLVTRLCKVLLGRDWRQGRPYKFQGELRPRDPRPTHVKEGMWVRVAESDHFERALVGRVGQIERIYWSDTGPSRGPAKKNTPPQWVAAVNFEGPKRKYFKGRRARFRLPVSALVRSRKTAWKKRERVRADDGTFRGWAPVGDAAPKPKTPKAKKAKKAAQAVGKQGSAPKPQTRAARLEDLPKTYTCNVCKRRKRRANMVVAFYRREQYYRIRPRCKACHNKRERGHRRDWKRDYLQRWRAANREKNDGYWKDNPRARERGRVNRSRYVEKHHDALLIQKRLRSKGISVTTADAEQLLKRFGICYPLRAGLTSEGLRECERLRAFGRTPGRKKRTSFEIRLRVYERGLFIEPSLQERPNQKTAERVREMRRKEREARATPAAPQPTQANDANRRDPRDHTPPDGSPRGGGRRARPGRRSGIRTSTAGPARRP